nr:dihydrofolate reductase [Betaproteobacteria bacterium]
MPSGDQGSDCGLRGSAPSGRGIMSFERRSSGICLIVAHARQRVIGCDGAMPWQLPEDLRHFRAQTLNASVVMGRKTFESLGRKLPNRYHVVISRNVAYRYKKYHPDLVVDDLYEVFFIKKGPIFLIGGAEVLKEALESNLVSKIHLTTVFDETKGNVFLPKIPESFKVREDRLIEDCNPKLRFQVLQYEGE